MKTGFFSKPTAVLLTSLLCGCAAMTERSVGVVEGELTECPAWPRCVSSQSVDPDKQVAAYRLAMPAEKAWPETIRTVAAMDRTRIVERTDSYLHAEVTSPWGVYTDDLELLLNAADESMHVRSSGRIGYYDFEVNRDRVESLRKALGKVGVVKGPLD